MNRQDIEVGDFSFDAAIIGKQWMLLTAGDFAPGKFNSMTISWGSCGEIWNKRFFQVVVRPTRYTREFLEKGEGFTLCVFPSVNKPALSLLGSKSGRDGDKIRESGLTPIPSSLVPAPGYDEAELVVECKKIYWQDLDPTHFLDPAIEMNYANKDYHRAYFGEILHVSGTDTYRRKKG